MESKVLAEVILSALKERKAFDIVKINVEEKTTVADYFIVASAVSVFFFSICIALSRAYVASHCCNTSN